MLLLLIFIIINHISLSSLNSYQTENWIRQEEQLLKDVNTGEWKDFTISEIQNIIKKHIIGN